MINIDGSLVESIKGFLTSAIGYVVIIPHVVFSWMTYLVDWGYEGDHNTLIVNFVAEHILIILLYLLFVWFISHLVFHINKNKSIQIAIVSLLLLFISNLYLHSNPLGDFESGLLSTPTYKEMKNLRYRYEPSYFCCRQAVGEIEGDINSKDVQKVFNKYINYFKSKEVLIIESDPSSSSGYYSDQIIINRDKNGKITNLEEIKNGLYSRRFDYDPKTSKFRISL